MRGVRRLAVAALLLTTACGGGGPLSTQQLEAVADSHLHYPGSKVVRADAVPQQDAQLNAAAVDGFVATTLTLDTSGDAVVAWYMRTLQSHGWTYRQREDHGDTNDGHPVPPAWLFTRGGREVFALTIDSTAKQYITTYIALTGHCNTLPPAPLGAGACDTGKPL